MQINIMVKGIMGNENWFNGTSKKAPGGYLKKH
jgi:hypothetical protein